MLVAVRERSTDPRFETAYTLCSGRTALLKWRFRCSVRQLGDIEFDGISEIVMDDDGLITSHIDYWDAGNEIYAKVPVLGRVVDFVRRRLAYRGG